MWELDYKETEPQRIDAFELWCWRRVLRVPWTARRSNQSILKEISPGCSLEGLMLKMKLQYFGYLMQRADSLEKTLMLGKIEGRRRRAQQSMRWLDGITDSMNMVLGGLGSWWWTGRPGMLRFMGSWRVHEGLDTTERLNWTMDKGNNIANYSASERKREKIITGKIYAFGESECMGFFYIFLSTFLLILNITPFPQICQSYI